MEIKLFRRRPRTEIPEFKPQVPPPLKPGEADHLAQVNEKHHKQARKRLEAIQEARAEADARRGY